MALNLRDSLVPPQIRGFAGTLFRQTSPWGSLRDQVFLIYQLNPLLALGCVGWIAAAREAVRRAGPRTAGSGGSGLRRWRPLWRSASQPTGAGTTTGRPHLPAVPRPPGTGLPCVTLERPRAGVAEAPPDRMGSGFLPRGRPPARRRGLRDRPLAHSLPKPPEAAQTYWVVAQENLARKSSPTRRILPTFSPTLPALILALMGAILCLALVRAFGRSRDPNRNDRIQNDRRHGDPRLQRGAVLPELFARLGAVFGGHADCSWRAVFVNDGSRDRTAEMTRAQGLIDSRFELVELSRNFGFQAALRRARACARRRRRRHHGRGPAGPARGDTGPRRGVALRRRGRPGRSASRSETGVRRAAIRRLSRLLRQAHRHTDRVQHRDLRAAGKPALEAFARLPERHRFFPGLGHGSGSPRPTSSTTGRSGPRGSRNRRSVGWCATRSMGSSASRTCP